MNPLQQFYANEPMREAVREFIIAQLKEEAVDKVFNKKAIAGIYEARKIVDKSFDKLEELYAIIKPTIIENSR